MPQRGHDLLLVEPAAVIAFDQQGRMPGAVEMLGPPHGLIERRKFLEEHAVLFDRPETAGALRAAIHAISHGCLLMACAPNAPSASSISKRITGRRGSAC